MPATQPEPTTKPDSYTEPTPECTYSFVAYEPSGDNILEVHLTADEFGKLKDHLGHLRGYSRNDEWERAIKEGIPGSSQPGLEEQLAADLEIARQAYASYPSLVVAEELPELEALTAETEESEDQ